MKNKQLGQLFSRLILVLFSFFFVNHAFSAPSFSLISVSISPSSPVPLNSCLSVTATFKNTGTTGTFDFECDLVTTSKGFIRLIEKQCNKTVVSGNSINLTFSTSSTSGNNDPNILASYSYGTTSYTIIPGSYLLQFSASTFGTSGCPACGTKTDPNCISYFGFQSLTISSLSCPGYCMDNTSLNACTGSFYDAGGKDNYGNRENYIKTFTPSSSGAKLKFSFSSFAVENNYDFLYIYDGPNTSATLIGKYTGTNSPGIVTATNTAGQLTFKFTSDNRNNCSNGYFSGWQASISCSSAPCNAPTNPSSNISFNNIGFDNLIFNWTRGNGQGRIVVCKEGGPVTGIPQDGKDYSYDTRFGYGEQLNTGEFVVYNLILGGGCSLSNLKANTKYYFSIFEYNCSGTSIKYLTSNYLSANQTTAKLCAKPATPNITSISATSSTSVSLTWSNTNAASYNIYYSTSSCYGSSTMSTSSSLSKTITSLTPNTTYNFWVTGYDQCESDPSTCKQVTSPNGPSIEITSSVIPPWQREGDAYDGSLTVATKNPSSAAWHLQIKVYNELNTLVTTINYSPIYQNTQKFFSTDPQLSATSKSGYRLEYYAVLESGGIAQPDQNTNTPKGSTNTLIIDRKLNNRTIVYYANDKDLNFIRIPINYNPSIDYSQIRLKFDRVSGTAATTELSKDILQIKFPPTILRNNDNDWFYTFKNGYFIIESVSSNLADVKAGEFIYSGFHNTSPIPNENGVFSLVKIGRLNNSNKNSQKVLISIGGIYNDVEGNFVSLNGDNLSYKKDSKLSFSLVPYIVSNNSNLNAWYIAQGNINGVMRNGYDIGMALDEIKRLTSAIEFDLICHSKGGLDTRALIENYALGLDNTIKTYSQFSSSSIIRKIVFLGTPHDGSPVADIIAWARVPYYSFITEEIRSKKLGQGLYDLTDMSSYWGIIKKLQRGRMPNNISYLNLSGIVNSYTLSDWVVPLTSSESFPNVCFQLYQNDPRSFYVPGWYDVLHMRLHQNNILSIEGKCTSQNSNLDKIESFINSGITTNCYRAKNFKGLLFLSGSILPHAKVEYKSDGSLLLQKIGYTDENGYLNFELFETPHINDKILISAPGIEGLEFSIDSTFIRENKLNVALFHSDIKTRNITNPAVSILNRTYVLDKNELNLKLSGQNIREYQVNSPFNQDSIFKPLNVDSYGLSNVTLDSGYNRIVLRFIGDNDTVIIQKEVFYFPSKVISEIAQNVSVKYGDSLNDVKIFVNGYYVTDIQNIATDFKVFKESKIKFTKFGFKDTTFKIDSTGTINLLMSPISYSSNSDSVKYDYRTSPNLNYWKNITTKKLNINANTGVSIKQFDDSFSEKALIPVTRTFQFRNTSLIGGPSLKTAICLDQSLIFGKSDAYMLDILDDTLYAKFPLEENGIADYDSAVQKFSFDSLNFGHGNAKKETLVLVRKQAPVAIKKSFNIQVNDSSLIPYSSLFADPDSVKNDLTFEILNPGLKHFTYHLTNNGLFVKPDKCYTGNLSIQIKATHDWLNTIQSYDIEVPEVLPNISVSGSANFCNGDSLKFTAFKSPNHIYRWYRNNSLVPDESKHELVIHAEGKYHLALSSSQTGCTYSSDTINIITTGSERWKDHCLRIFPNPSYGWVTVQMEGRSYPVNLTIEVFDVWGRLIKIYERKIEPTYLINEQYDLNELENGIYFLRTTLNNEKAITRKLNISR